jgi:hypothetical protein
VRRAVLLAAIVTGPVAADCQDAGALEATALARPISTATAQPHECALIGRAKLLPDDLVVDVRSDSTVPALPGIVRASFAQLLDPPFSSASRLVLAGSGADDRRVAAECGTLVRSSARVLVLRSGVRALAAELQQASLGSIQPATAAALDRDGLVELTLVDGEGEHLASSAGVPAALDHARRAGRPLVIGVPVDRADEIASDLGRDAIAKDVFWIAGGVGALTEHMTRFAATARTATTRTAAPCFWRR